jgi:hypothetical protein
MNTVYEDTCTVHCTDTGKEMEAEVMDFRAGHYLKVSVQRKIALHMNYADRFNEYVGSAAGLEFTTAGPKGRDVTGRTRHF